MDLSQIESIHLGSTEIGEVYKGSSKIWPAGGVPVFEEKHSLLAVFGNATVSGLERTGYGWVDVRPQFSAADDKFYFEYTFKAWDPGYTAANAVIHLQSSVIDIDVISIYADGRISNIYGTYTGNQIGDATAVTPSTICVAVDRSLSRAWARLNDGPWCGDVSINPSNGDAGINFSAGDVKDGEAVIQTYQDGDTDVAEFALHASQYKYAAPVGFGELVVAGEYT